MIEQNKNEFLIEFGTGDIRVTSCCEGTQGCLSLIGQGKHPIGTKVSCEKTIEDLKDMSDVLLTFDNIESLEVVILKLQEVRRYMLGRFDYDDSDVDIINKIYEPNSKIDDIPND